MTNNTLYLAPPAHTLHNGLIGCPIYLVNQYMPELDALVKSAPIPHINYIVDVKVHMLMPGQFPCIPGKHGDMIPRDADKNLRHDLIDPTQRLFLWISGPPITQFEDGRPVVPGEWVEFGQSDIHWGVVSESHQWRIFIRLCPRTIYPNVQEGSNVIRRHTQVYLNAENFTW